MNIILTDPSGIIKTPGYPANYPSDLIKQCVWKIIAPKGQVVRVAFLSFRMAQSHYVDIKYSINKEDTLEFSLWGGKPSFTV